MAIPDEPTHRFLSHNKGLDSPLNGENLEARAEKDKDGYCIAY